MGWVNISWWSGQESDCRLLVHRRLYFLCLLFFSSPSLSLSCLTFFVCSCECRRVTVRLKCIICCFCGCFGFERETMRGQEEQICVYIFICIVNVDTYVSWCSRFSLETSEKPFLDKISYNSENFIIIFPAYKHLKLEAFSGYSGNSNHHQLFLLLSISNVIPVTFKS